MRLDHLRSKKRLTVQAETAARTRVVEMNRRVAAILESIIGTIQSAGDGSSNDAK